MLHFKIDLTGPRRDEKNEVASIEELDLN